MAGGINPQGYFRINFGSFVPTPSFRVRQQLAATRRNAAAANGEDPNHFIRIPRPGCSLPEIKVKKLLSTPRKHSRSHTFDGASSNERPKFPMIPIAATGSKANARHSNHLEERRVVRNGEPWWKWSKKNREKRWRVRPHHAQCPAHDSNVQIQPRKKTVRRQVHHNLRQKLPPLVGYRDKDGKLLYSEVGNNANTRILNDRYDRDIFLNRRFYYSRSRSGIQPCLPVAKMSNACLVDLSSIPSTEPEFVSHRQAMLSSMQQELQAVTGLQYKGGFLGTQLPIPGSSFNLGMKLKQSLNKKKHFEEDKRALPVVNIDSSFFSESQSEVSNVPCTSRVSPNNVRAIAVLDELIDILEGTQYIRERRYEADSQPKSRTKPEPTLSYIDLSELFQKSEEFVRWYDRFKKITNSSGRNYNYLNRSGEKNDVPESESPDHEVNHDHLELSRLLAIQRLQASHSVLMGTDHDRETDRHTSNHSEPSETDSGPSLQPGSEPRSISQTHNSSDVHGQMAHVDLNGQYLKYSDGTLGRMKRRPSVRKLAHNVSKLLLVEPVERPPNPRPDLEINGERLKYLYDLGLLEEDQELRNLAVQGQFIYS